MLTPDPPNTALCPSHFPIFKKGLHWTLPSFSNSMTDPTKADCSQTLVSTLASKQVQVCTHSHDQHFCRPAFAFLSRTHFNITVQIRWCTSPSPFLKDNNILSWVGVFRNNKKLRLYMSNCNTKLAFVLIKSVQASHLLKTDETSPNSFWIAELLRDLVEFSTAGVLVVYHHTFKHLRTSQ